MPGKQMAIDADLSAGPDRRDRGQAAAQGAGAGIDLLRGHGRRLEVRARRRRRRPDHHRHQRHRRHPDRGDAARAAARRGGHDLHPADHRRRPGQPDAGADHLHRRRLPGLQGAASRARPTRRWSPSWPRTRSPGHGLGRVGRDRPGPRHADHPVRRALARRRRPGLATRRRSARTRRGGRRSPTRRPPRRRREEPIAQSLAIDEVKIELGYGLLQPDQRPGGPPAHRPDQGAAPHAGRRVRLRHAAGAHPRQHAPAHPGLRHPHQGDGGRRRRGAAGLADGHGPARRPGRAARRARARSRPSACPPPGSTTACARRPPSAATPSSIRPRC